MPTIDPNMGFEYPVIGGSLDTWGNLLTAALEAISAHDHQPGSGVPIKSASIRWDGDITAAYNGDPWALLGARALGLEPVSNATVSGDSNVFYVDSDRGNELFFKDNANNAVRITNGGQLDISLLGGIGGDYSTVGASVSYSDADKAYSFRQLAGLGQPWAYLRSGPIDLYQPSTAGITARVRLQSPNALAASYAVTFPGALPSSAGLMALDSSGNITARRTWVMNVGAAAFQPITGTGTATTSGVDWTLQVPPNDMIVAPIVLPVGARIQSIVWHLNHNGAGGTMAFDVRKWTPTTESSVSSVTDASGGAAYITKAHNSINYTIASGYQVLLRVAGGAANNKFAMAEVTFDW